MSDTADVAITTSNVILIITCIVGNFFVCVVVMKNREMRTPINYLLVNLATADICYATFIIPTIILNHNVGHPKGIFGTFLCAVITGGSFGGSFAWIGGVASMFTLLVIAFERYFAVVHPHGNRGKLTLQRLKGVLRLRKRVTLMVVTVSAILVISWGADAILHLLDEHAADSVKLSPLAISIAHTMLLFNSAINPFAYALLNQRFRKKMRQMIRSRSFATWIGAMFMRRGESQDNDTGHTTGSIQMTQQDQLRERAATISRENVL